MSERPIEEDAPVPIGDPPPDDRGFRFDLPDRTLPDFTRDAWRDEAMRAAEGRRQFLVGPPEHIIISPKLPDPTPWDGLGIGVMLVSWATLAIAWCGAGTLHQVISIWFAQ